MAETYSAGIVTAYGAAVRGGYTGTYEQFCAEQAQFGANAAKVAQDRAAVEAATQTFTTVTVPGAVQAVQQTGATQVQAVEAASETEQQQIALAGAAQETRVTQAGDDQVDAVEEAGATQVGNVNTAGTTQVGNVNTAGTTQVGAVNTAGATQVQAVEDKGQEVIGSIPSDYTDLTEDVADLKSALNQAIEDFAVPTQEAVDNWLNSHPEATTTVEDNSLTTAKYRDGSITDAKLSETGVKRTKIGYNVFPQYRITPTHVIDLPSLEGYYPQGFAFDGTYYYVGYLDTATYHNGIIVKYDTTGNEIARSTDTYNHVNAIEIINNKLYVASLGDIFVANITTLAKESTISCRGGSGFVANVQFSGSYGGVPGNQALQYVMLSSSKGMEVYYNAKKVDCIAVPSSPLTPQGGTGYNGYIYAVESAGSDIGTNGIINVWDVQGNTCAQISIELAGELEDVSIISNNMYMLNSMNSVPTIYTASISMLTPYLPVLNWYNCKGQRYQCDLTYSNSTQLTKITVPPIVDIFLAYAQPCQFDVITNAFFAKAGYNSSGFEITYFENNVSPASFLRLHYTRTGAQTYEMDSCSIVSLADGSTTSEWNSSFPRIDALFITTEFSTR